MAGTWKVEASDAYLVWVLHHWPFPDDEQAMTVWLDELQHDGPPVSEPGPGSTRTATGPNGEKIQFMSWDLPPDPQDDTEGHIFIMRIDPKVP